MSEQLTFFEIGDPAAPAFDHVSVLARYRGQWLLCRGETGKWRIPTDLCLATQRPQEAVCALLMSRLGIGLSEQSVILLEGYLGSVGDCGALLVAEIPPKAILPDDICAVPLLPSPNALEDPERQTTLFERTQYRLNLRANAGELWDVLNCDRNPTGRTHPRGIPLPAGDYHTVVLVLLQNRAGKILITRRAPNKGFPNMWEITGGSALAGDDSRRAAVREVCEETGIVLDPVAGQCIATERRNDCFLDLWHFEQDFDLSQVTLQEGETTAACMASKAEIIGMERDGEFVPFVPILRQWMEKS